MSNFYKGSEKQQPPKMLPFHPAGDWPALQIKTIFFACCCCCCNKCRKWCSLYGVKLYTSDSAPNLAPTSNPNCTMINEKWAGGCGGGFFTPVNMNRVRKLFLSWWVNSEYSQYYRNFHSIIPVVQTSKSQNRTSQSLSLLAPTLRAHFAVRWESVSLIRPLSMANRPLFSDQHLSLSLPKSKKPQQRKESKRRQLIPPDCGGNRRLNAARPCSLALCPFENCAGEVGEGDQCHAWIYRPISYQFSRLP